MGARAKVGWSVLSCLFIVLGIAFFQGGANSYAHEAAAWLGIGNSITLEVRSPSVDPMAIQVSYVRVDEGGPPEAVLSQGRGTRFSGAVGAFEFKISYRGELVCSAGYFADRKVGGNRYRVCCAQGSSGFRCSIELDGLPIPGDCGGYPVASLCPD